MTALRHHVFAFCVLASLVRTVSAAEIRGQVLDAHGALLPGASVSVESLASGLVSAATTDGSGAFAFRALLPGLYRVSAGAEGFSEEALLATLGDDEAVEDVRLQLSVGQITATVTVTAARNSRDSLLVPPRAETLTVEDVRALSPVSTGDLLLKAPGVTPVGNGPFQVRPRLRGLDSTRVLVLVDGERLNNARTATDRAGVEVSLVDMANVESVEIVSGAGSVLYGTDALSGTINIITRQPSRSDTFRLSGGLSTYWSSNEDGRRGTAFVGASGPRFGVRLAATGESFDPYHSGADFAEDSRPLFAAGTLRQLDTIDSNFRGFNLRAFPDPFNAPYVRTSDTVPNSAFDGNSFSGNGVFQPSATQTLSLKYLRRHASDIGFPDFEPPLFFQGIVLPFSNLDKVSVRYQRRLLSPWFSSLTATAYWQEQDRKLQNVAVPVQFPAPTAQTFFPINVMRLVIDSSTQQNVKTAGLDVQGTFLLSPRNVLTAGFTLYRDRSHDTRLSRSQLNLVGNVTLGSRGPQANVFPALRPLGPPSETRPTRVPDASFRDFGVFVQDEWHLTSSLRAVAGLRFDFYRVNTSATPGYDPLPLIANTTPAIDAATLPKAQGDSISRTPLTGDVGLIYRLTARTSLTAHYGRSYRHPNLEELLFAGPATIGSIVPNVTVEPERGDNFDAGFKVRSGRVVETLSYFHNTYRGFISQEFVATQPGNQIVAQAINFAKVRIQGIEADIEAPFDVGGAIVTLFGAFAYTRGQVLSGTNRLTGASLDDTPLDNISPLKLISGIRVSDKRKGLWGEYSNRIQKKVERVSPVLLDSPFLIAQDLYGLNGFNLHRLAAGYEWNRSDYVAGVTLALENFGDRYYREQFQFAPGRGRSFTVALRLERR